MLVHETTQATIEALSRPRFEVVPIKGIADKVASLARSITVTVTCSPTGGIEPTLKVVEQLAGMGFDAVPHLSARMITGYDHLEETIQRLTRAGVRNIYVIGGDARTPLGPFANAGSLLEALLARGCPFEEIGVAAYPEGHPLLDDDRLWQVLHEKQHMATYVVTQMCFDPDAITRWARDARQNGITLPILAGIPGVVSRTHLLRIASKIGVGESARFLGRHSGMLSRLVRPGKYTPDSMIDELSSSLADPDLDIRGLHIYTFNHLEPTENWRQKRLSAEYWK